MNHGFNDGQEIERLYADLIDEWEENNTKFLDSDFNYTDKRNFGSDERNNYAQIPSTAEVSSI